ncbi:MAG: glycosyltransferase [Acidobacteriota bacterium]
MKRKTMSNLVSVIIPNFNYAEFLDEAVNSVLSQTYPNVEIVIIDDGSTDNSRSVIDGLGDSVKSVFQENAGVSAARNNGFKLCCGDYIAFLDADDVWLPTKIEEQMKIFSEDPEIGLVHSGYLTIDHAGNELEEFTTGASGKLSEEFLLFEKPVILVGGSGMILKKALFDDVSGFDLNLTTSADWDLCRRVALKCKVGFSSKVLVKYRMHGTNMHGNIRRMEREMIYGYEKAFSDADAKTFRLQRKAYGNLWKVLAGSYFHAKDYSGFARNAVKSIWNKPSNFGYFASFPLRRLRRRTQGTNGKEF